MQDKKSPNKIKIEKQVYWHEKNTEMTWKDIKHLQLEDDDVIRSAWVDDENAEYNGYWHGEITRMVEETDEQYEKRQERNRLDAERMKKQRYENYLRLKQEFENV